MVFESNKWNWRDSILKAQYLHCSNIKARKISSIKVCDWLTSSEYFNLSEIKLLIPKVIFSLRPSKWTVCIPCNSNPTNWSIVENVFLNELVLSGTNDESLCKSFQPVKLHRYLGKHIYSVFVIIIPESNATSVKWTMNNSKTNVGVHPNHVEFRSGSD